MIRLNNLLISFEAAPLNQQTFQGHIAKLTATSLIGKTASCTVLTSSLGCDVTILRNSERIHQDVVTIKDSEHRFLVHSYQIGQISYHILNIENGDEFSDIEYKLVFNLICQKLLEDYYEIDTLFLHNYETLLMLLHLKEKTLKSLKMHFLKSNSVELCMYSQAVICDFFGYSIQEIAYYFEDESNLCHVLLRKYIDCIFVLFEAQKTYYIEQCYFSRVYVLESAIDGKLYSPMNAAQIPVCYQYDKFSVAKRMNKVSLQRELNIQVDQKYLLFICEINDETMNAAQMLVDMIECVKSHKQCQLVIYDKTKIDLNYSLSSNIRLIKKSEVPHLAYAASDFYICFESKEYYSDKHYIAMRYGSIPIVPNVYYYTESIMPIIFDEDQVSGNAVIIPDSNTRSVFDNLCNHFINDENELFDIQKNNIRYDSSIEKFKHSLMTVLLDDQMNFHS